MGLIDRLFGGSDTTQARKAELGGDLALAVVLWMDAGRPDEAARVMILRGDSELDPRARLQHYTQAVATAPEGHETLKRARLKRAELTVSLAQDVALTPAHRADLLDAARELEVLGECVKAADAFAVAGDLEGEARALAKAGDVDKLEDLLSSQQDKERTERRRREAHAEIELLAASGRRREALDAARAFAREQPDDPSVHERAHAIEGRRAKGPLARVAVRGAPIALVLGAEVIVGRTEGALLVPSHAVSRRHVILQREGERVILRDLGSRNGTQLRGIALGGAVPVVDEGIELTLGKEIPLRLAPSRVLDGGIEIEIRGERYLAPLGPARLGIGAWKLEQGSDGWLELATEEGPTAYLDGVTLVPRATLLVGDAVASARQGEPVLRVLR